MASAGNSTKSSKPTTDDKPTALSNITSMGVKQHSAVAMVPNIPTLNNFFVFIRPCYAHLATSKTIDSCMRLYEFLTPRYTAHRTFSLLTHILNEH